MIGMREAVNMMQLPEKEIGSSQVIISMHVLLSCILYMFINPLRVQDGYMCTLCVKWTLSVSTTIILQSTSDQYQTFQACWYSSTVDQETEYFFSNPSTSMQYLYIHNLRPTAHPGCRICVHCQSGKTPTSKTPHFYNFLERKTDTETTRCTAHTKMMMHIRVPRTGSAREMATYIRTCTDMCCMCPAAQTREIETQRDRITYNVHTCGCAYQTQRERESHSLTLLPHTVHCKHCY